MYTFLISRCGVEVSVRDLENSLAGNQQKLVTLYSYIANVLICSGFAKVPI